MEHISKILMRMIEKEEQVKRVCMGCEERYPGCHDHCPKRAEEQAQFRRMKETIRAAQDLECDYLSYEINRARRMKQGLMR